MVVTIGYKQTEAGVIPDDWQVLLLRDVVDFRNGKPHERNVESDGRYWLITLDSVGIDGRLKAEHKRTTVFDSSLKTNDIVAVLSDLAHGNLLGLCDLIPADGTYVLNQRMGRLRLKVPADAPFVRLQINRRQDHFRKRGQGTSQKHVYKRDFDALPIPFPTPAEQEAITEALSPVDVLIGTLEQLIAKKYQIKHGAMRELLRGGKRLPGFSGGWEARALGDIATASKGSQLSRSSMTEHGRFAHLNGGVAPSGYTDKANALGDTIAISEGGNSCGYVQFMSEAYWCGGHCYSVIPTGVDNRFLYHALKGQEASIMGLRVGSGLPNVQKVALLAFNVRCPTAMEEQTAIATVLSDMDADIAVLKARLEKTGRLRQAMMQQLLTGRIRLL